MLHYGIINNMNSLYYSSIEVLIAFINSVITLHVFFISNSIFLKLLMVALIFSLKVAKSSCLLNSLSASGWLIISATRSINFQMVFSFYISLSSLCLFSIRQLRELLADPWVSVCAWQSEPEQYFWPFFWALGPLATGFVYKKNRVLP